MRYATAYRRLAYRSASRANACSSMIDRVYVGERRMGGTLCHAPGGRLATSGQASSGRTRRRLPQGGEGRRDQELVLLANGSDPGLGRPLAVLARLLPDPRPLVGVPVDPDVHELVQPPDVAGPGRGQRRELLAGAYGLAPRLQHPGQVARRVGVDAHLVDVAGAEVTAPQRLHERRGDHDVGLLLDDQVAPPGQRVQLGVLGHRLADPGALTQIGVGPDVDDLVEWAEVGMPEGAQLRVL